MCSFKYLGTAPWREMEGTKYKQDLYEFQAKAVDLCACKVFNSLRSSPDPPGLGTMEQSVLNLLKVSTIPARHAISTKVESTITPCVARISGACVACSICVVLAVVPHAILRMARK